jgi:hypothetical protein
MRLKLGPHFLPGGDDCTQQWLKLKPAVAKFVYSFDIANGVPPEVLCVGRPEEDFLSQHPLLSGDPVALAQQFAATVLAPLVQRYPRIDVWEGPNEIDIRTSQPDGLQRMDWYSAFLAEYARQMDLLGKRALVGAWAVGNPEFSIWQRYVPVLQACRDHHAILSRHSYGPLDQWYSFRHRQDEAAFQQLGFANTPVIISECGADRLGNFPGRWRKVWGDRIDRYWQEYLLPFTQEIEKDAYVLGATLFTVGTGFSQAWRDFDVTDTNLVANLASYAQTLPPEAPPVTPPPSYPYDIYVVKTGPLNTRLYPWTGESVPNVIRQLEQGEQVKVYGIYKPKGMIFGWGSLSPDSNEWVNMQYLEFSAPGQP